MRLRLAAPFEWVRTAAFIAAGQDVLVFLSARYSALVHPSISDLVRAMSDQIKKVQIVIIFIMIILLIQVVAIV